MKYKYHLLTMTLGPLHGSQERRTFECGLRIATYAVLDKQQAEALIAGHLAENPQDFVMETATEDQYREQKERLTIRAMVFD